MTDGLKNIKHALLQQESDPLEFCVCPLPIPSQIGIPCFPCELPNNFQLYQTNENYNQIGMKIMDLEEESTCLNRSLFFPSLRPFNITSRDFYNNIPIQAKRNLSIPFFKNCRPNIQIFYEGAYAGKVEEPFGFHFCKGKFHELEIFDAHNELRFTLVAPLKQLGLLLFLPFKQCSTITYQIYDQKISSEENTLVREACGSINHIFFGLNEEYCSKADQYGICFPDSASEKDKALIVMAAIFIDYLWFENF